MRNLSARANHFAAGCKPGYLPVVIGAMECVLEERFNLLLLQATTSAGAPFVLVNGRYAAGIGLHGGSQASFLGYVTKLGSRETTIA